MSYLRNTALIIFVLSHMALQASSALADPVDLNDWTAESYPMFGDDPSHAGVWTVSPDGDSVTQSTNGQPTLFYSDFNAFGTKVSGTIQTSNTDDDFIGFVLGFQPNDTTNVTADYLLVDWKRGPQFNDFAAPSVTPGTMANAGLAVSRVRGLPTTDEFWGHVDFPDADFPGTDGGLTELARGNTLGNTGWLPNQAYEFDFIFTQNNLQVFVDDVLELDINGSFDEGRMGFYNFSQPAITYSAFEVESVSTPEPASILALLSLGMVSAVGLRRKR